MKIRFFPTVLVLLTMLFLFPVYTAASSPSVIIDGDLQAYDQPPVVEAGRTLVPLRGIFESLGATVEWEPETGTIQARQDDVHVELRVGEANATVNDEVIQLDVPSTILNGRTLVPLRFVSEALGASVQWDGSNRTIEITSPQTEEAPESEPEHEPPSEDPGIPDNSRANPAQVGETLTLSRTDHTGHASLVDVTLTEIISGSRAWDMVSEANRFNDEPAADERYILAKMRVDVHETAGEQALSLSPVMFDLFNEEGSAYTSGSQHSVSGLSPSFRTDVSPGGSHEGWLAFTVKEADSPTLVMDRNRYSEAWFDLHVEVDDHEPEEEHLPVDPPELSPPDLDTDEVNSRQNPAQTGEVFTLHRTRWTGEESVIAISLTDLISGNQAWQIVQDANMFNRQPDPGEEYILAKFRVHVLETSDNRAFSLSHTLFDLFTADGIAYNRSSQHTVSGLSPAFRTDVYPGATHEGWLAFTVKEQDDPLVVIDRNTDSETWFDLRSDGTELPSEEEGEGQLYYDTGELSYDGDMKHGAPHGEGTSFWRNGNIAYEGSYKDGLMHGDGAFYLKEGTLAYEGMHQNNAMEGTGVMYNRDGSILYEGEFQDNQFHGQGTLYRLGGSGEIFFEGRFQHGDIVR